MPPRPCSRIDGLLPVFPPANKNEDPCYSRPLALGGRSRKGGSFDSAAVSAILVLLELFGVGADVDVLEKTAQMVKTTIVVLSEDAKFECLVRRETNLWVEDGLTALSPLLWRALKIWGQSYLLLMKDH
jgi:hypothetical protein